MSDNFYLILYFAIIPMIAITAYYNYILLNMYAGILFTSSVALTFLGK